MLVQLLFRMLIGGLCVCVFASLGDMLEPKRFAGLFGAAPSVALATLALTAGTNGREYAGIEARSMVAGAIAFMIYAYCVFRMMLASNLSARVSTLILIPVWLASAFGIWRIWIRG